MLLGALRSVPSNDSPEYCTNITTSNPKIDCNYKKSIHVHFQSGSHFPSPKPTEFKAQNFLQWSAPKPMKSRSGILLIQL